MNYHSHRIIKKNIGLHNGKILFLVSTLFILSSVIAVVIQAKSLPTSHNVLSDSTGPTLYCVGGLPCPEDTSSEPGSSGTSVSCGNNGSGVCANNTCPANRPVTAPATGADSCSSTFGKTGICCYASASDATAVSVGNTASVNTANRAEIADEITKHVYSDGELFNILRPEPFYLPPSTYAIRNRHDWMVNNHPTYWCTGLLTSTFSISGIPMGENRANVMAAQWNKMNKSLLYSNYIGSTSSQRQDIVKHIQPGDGLFFGGWCIGRDICHVGIVYSITINRFGDGVLMSREANSNAKAKKYPISNWLFTGTAIRGIGGVKQV